MKRAVVFIIALAAFCLCRGPDRTPAKHSAVRSARIALPTRVAAQLREVKLDPTGIDAAFVVRGVVETANGVPIAGARVVALTMHREELAATTTEEDGSYELVIQAGEVLVEADARGFARDTAYFWVKGVHEKRFQLVVAGALHGRVVRADGVACAAKVVVRIGISDQRYNWWSVDTDERGAFSIENMPPGDVELTAHGPGCVTGRATELVLALGQTLDDVEMRAERGYAISGVVVDAVTLRPVAGVRVHGSWPDVLSDRTAYTDAGGRFVIHGFLADEVRVYARSPGFEADATVQIVDRDVELRIELAAVPPEEPWPTPKPGEPIDVSFAFEDPSGIPVALTRVSLTFDSGEVREASTSADGDVWFPRVPREAHVRVHVEGRRILDPAVEDDGLFIHTQILRLVALPLDADPAAPIRGRVLDADGKPAANIFISSSTPNAAGRETVSRADGSFEVGTAWDATHEITATSAHADLTAKVLARPGETVTIRLERRFHVEIRVTRDGTAVDQFSLLCKSGDRWLGDTTLHAGRLRSLEAGPLRCDVFSDVGSGTGTIVVAHGAPNVLAIALAANATITGRLVSHTGAPMAAMTFVVHGPYGYDDLEPYTDADGRFVITGVPAGATEIEVRGDTSAKVTTSPGARVDVGDVRVP